MGAGAVPAAAASAGAALFPGAALSDAALLAGLPGWAFGFVLVLCRSGAAVMLLPGLGEAEPPAMLRAGLALILAVLLLPAMQPALPPVPGDALSAAAMIAAELLVGGLLGWLARIVALALPVAGQIVSTMLGLSSVLQPDPTFGGQGTALSRLFGLAAPVLVLAAGLYAPPLQALAGSYRLVAPGAFLPAGDTAETAMSAVAESFALALRLAAPFILASVIWQVAMGLLARLVPHLQVFFLAQSAQIAGGLLLLAATALAILESWGEAARAALAGLPGL